MIIKHEGRYMIALSATHDLDAVSLIQKSLIDVVSLATTSPNWLNAQETIYWTCQLLDEMNLTPQQYFDLGRGNTSAFDPNALKQQ